MTLPKVVQDRLQALSDRKLNTWQDMAVEWPAGSTEPINADAFLSLIVEVKRQRAELHRLTEIAEGVEPLVIRFGEVTEAFQRSDEQAERLGNRLTAANALLLDVSRYLDPRHYAEAIKRIQSHLQGVGDEA